MCASFVELAIFEISESAVIKSGVFCQDAQTRIKNSGPIQLLQNREKIRSASELKSLDSGADVVLQCGRTLIDIRAYRTECSAHHTI